MKKWEEELMNHSISETLIQHRENNFISEQFWAMTSGAGHHRSSAPAPSAVQRILMAASSACYMGCAFTWWHFDSMRCPTPQSAHAGLR